MTDDWLRQGAFLLAEGINPLLAACLLVTPLTAAAAGRQESPRAGAAWVVRCGLGVAAATLLAKAGKRYEVWGGHPLFPSGHTAFAVTAAVCLVARDRRWAIVAVPSAALIMWGLVRAGYHDVPDVLGGAALGLAVGAATVRGGRSNSGSAPTAPR
jgi:membrane-associated phospholipid phosphatase